MSFNMTLYRNANQSNRLNGAYPNGDEPVSSLTEVALSLSLATAGRLGFYIDYSELSTADTHTFYVCRTHGTTGAVTVDYATSGDTHTTVSGTLSWADGEADIKSFTVAVSAGDLSTHSGLGLGEHRIVATLSNATGGAALHRESVSGNWTRAYGIVDNSSMIASDTNAYFFNADAVSNGSGTQASPYNSWYSLKTAQHTSRKRYLYMQGTFAHDNTWIDLDNNAEAMGGSSEATRVYFMQWPGQVLSITSDASRIQNGFYSDSDTASNYITFKNITLNGLDNTLAGGPGFAFRARANNKGWTIEHCSVIDEVQANNSGQASIYLESEPVGCNVYKTLIDNPVRGDGNPGVGIEAYDGGTHSISSCTFVNTTGIYQKDAPAIGEFGMTVRHCLFGAKATALFDNLGTNPQGQYHVFQGNVLNYTDHNIYTDVALQFGGAVQGPGGGAGVWCVGNVINGGGRNNGNFPSVKSEFHDSGLVFFNNIWVNGFGHLRIEEGTSAIEYLDYDHSHNVALAGSALWEFVPSFYGTTAAMQAATPYEDNYTDGDPLFTNLALNDVTLQAGSPCIGSGLSGTDKGVYLTNTEQLGA